MDDCGGRRYEGLIATVRKKRSQMLRRPRTQNLTVPGSHDQSPLTSPSDDADGVSSDEYPDDADSGEGIYNLNYSISRDSSANRFKGDYSKKNKEDGGSSATYDNARQGDDTNPRHFPSVRKLENAEDGIANDSKLKKLNLKAGGATHTIQTKNSSYGSSGSLLSSKSARTSDASQPRQNLTPQDDSSEDSPPAYKKSGLKGISCEDFPGGTFGASKSNVEKMPMKNVLEKQGEKPHQNHKIRRMPRRLVLDGLDEDEEDDEIHYLEELKLGRELRKTRSLYRGLKADKNEMLEDVGSSGKEVKRISNRGSEYTDYEEELLSDYEEELLSDYEEEELLSDGEAKRTKKKEKQMKESYETSVETKSEISLTTQQRALLSGKEVKRISTRGYEYTDYVEEELLSDREAKQTKKEKQMKESDETLVETKNEISLTTRQRALLLRRDSSATSVNQIGYPYGCPPAPPQKQKEKLSEVEQQQKKAEAAQRRRIRYEKAARESEAEAIRKVRGQKREEKIKKQQEELAQEKAAKELAPNTIRTVMSPAGTTITFSPEIGLPSIFDSKPCSYPPPREKCAGPSCVNPYKYRDSKSNLPLCSLKCYKAIHEKMQD